MAMSALWSRLLGLCGARSSQRGRMPRFGSEIGLLRTCSGTQEAQLVESFDLGARGIGVLSSSTGF